VPLSKKANKARMKSTRVVQPMCNLKDRKYHPLIYALTDPIKRAKLQSVCDELGKRHLLDRLYYGIGKNSIDFSIVNQMLEATR